MTPDELMALVRAHAQVCMERDYWKKVANDLAGTNPGGPGGSPGSPTPPPTD